MRGFHPDYVRAFRFCKDAQGVVEMFIKGSPSAPDWHGENSRIGAPGYKILRELPPKPPLPKLVRKDIGMKEEYYKRLAGDRVRMFCNINNLGPMLDILLKMAREALPLLVPHMRGADDTFAYGGAERAGSRRL